MAHRQRAVERHRFPGVTTSTGRPIICLLLPTRASSPHLPSPPLPLLPFSYSDLLAHWQLKAALRGAAPPYDAGQLSDVIEATGTTTQALMKLEREAESYWVAEYFRQAARWVCGVGWCMAAWLLIVNGCAVSPHVAAVALPPASVLGFSREWQPTSALLRPLRGPLPVAGRSPPPPGPSPSSAGSSRRWAKGWREGCVIAACAGFRLCVFAFVSFCRAGKFWTALLHPARLAAG